jgi:hypothetical protein
MKNVILCMLVSLLGFQSCKKDKEDGPSGSSSYNLIAPACLVSKMKIDIDGDVTNSAFVYDGQRRIVSNSQTGSEIKTTYACAGNTMTVEDTEEDIDGNIVKKITTNYLNAMGFISKSIEEDSSQTLYSYDAKGYLIREIKMSSFGTYTYGKSYQYVNGNKVKSYSLNVDQTTGVTIDSTVSESYFYYETMPGKFEEFSAWIERTGRGNKNELKSVSGGFSTAAYEYVVGPNGLPNSINLTYIFGAAKIDLTWRCN